MEKIKVADLKNGMKIISRYLLTSKKIIPFKGKQGFFLALTLEDSSGQIEAKIWDRAEEIKDTISIGSVLEVKGEVREYNSSLQLNILSFRVCLEEEYISRDFLPVSPRNIDQMTSELRGIIDTIQDNNIKKLVDDFFNDSDWLKRFQTAPAAKANHQAYLGGLLEHTLNITKAALEMVKLYPVLDRDLMIIGSVFHDIGKISEYSYEKTIDFTDEGRLLGHIIVGVNEVDKRISNMEVPFPQELRLKILHIITSHHGQYEWQSPKKPKFIEAAAIHILDNFDTVIDMFTKIKDEENTEDSDWSPWVRNLERRVYLK
ncbi:MAG: HD domain-containing protein [Peptococcaceae bacterium]|nr:HD domain-containing protein [Peptococcaceae bacterium]